MSSIRLRTVVLGLAVLALAAAPAFAQAPTTGSIYGGAFDETPSPLAGVTVTVTGPTAMGTPTTSTNTGGLFRFPSLPIGVYTVSFAKDGYESVVRTGIPSRINASSMVYVQMKAVAQKSETTGEGETGRSRRDTQVQGNITGEQAANIPNARDIWALIGVAPGTTVTSFDVGGSGAGTQVGYATAGISGQTRTQVDGVNATEGTSGTGYFNYGAFAEVAVGTASNDASMPSPGAQTNAVLKTGSNKFSADVYFDYENSTLQGTNVTDALQRVGVGEGQRITRYYDLNTLTGGPIMKDKLWFFFSLRSQQIGTKVTGYPVESPGFFNFPTNLGWATEKINFQLNKNNRFSHYIEFRMKRQRQRGAGSTAYRDSVYFQDSLSPYANLEWERVVNDSFFFNLRFGTWGYNWANYAWGLGEELKKNVQTRKYDYTTSNEQGGYSAGRNYRRRWQLDWSGILFKDNWAGGDHAFKFAYLNEWEVYRPELSGYKDGIQQMYRSAAGAGDFVTPYQIRIFNTPYHRPDSILSHQGAYFMDQVQLGQRLSFSAGLRWDLYDNYYRSGEMDPAPWRDFFYAGVPLSNGYSIPATFPTFKYEGKHAVKFNMLLAPRLAASFDVQGNGKTVLKFNWGRYYFNVGPRADTIPIQTTYYTFAWNDVDRDREFDTGSEFGAFSSSSGGAVNTVDPNLKNSYTDDMSVWVEQQILPTLSGRAVFIYRKSDRQFENFQINRVYGLYTAVVQQFDPGLDGLTGTADDKGSFPAWDIPAGVVIPASQTELRSPDDYETTVKSIDFTLNKRMSQSWSASFSFLRNWVDNPYNGVPQNPNEAVNNDQITTASSMKILGSYQAPYGIRISPVMRYQIGTNQRRVVQTTGLRTGTFNYAVEPWNAYRTDNIMLFDLRAEKEMNLPKGQQIGVFFDAFNIMNSNNAQNMDEITGRRTVTIGSELVNYQRFMRPTTILAPRIFRFGFKYGF